jgi:fumarate hydratase subunit beta
VEHRLVLPLRDEDIRRVHAGDTVFLSGRILTARDAAHKRIVQILDNGSQLPFELEDSAVYYTGPCPAPPGLPIGSCGPTTSSRMDGWSPRLIALGLKVMIGKGQRSGEVIKAITDCCGLYLCATGGAGALYARCVKSARIVAFEDLGAEAVRELEVADMPLIAAIDCRGNDLFESGPAAYSLHPPTPSDANPHPPTPSPMELWEGESLAIRPLTPGDAGAAMALYRRVVAAMHEAGFMQWNDRYPNGETLDCDIAAGTAYGGFIYGRLAAAATFDAKQPEEYGPMPFAFGAPYGIVHRLAVEPALQRRGLAQRMMDFAEEAARGCACKAMRLDTCEDNAAALALYEGRGYIRRGKCRFPGRERSFIVMEKML